MPDKDRENASRNNAPKTVPNSMLGGRLDSIDGLRGLACLMVIFFHLNRAQFSWPRITFGARQLSLPQNVLTYGYLGVDIFFVLSAFCLSYPIFKRPEQSPDWPTYFKRRAIRIMPPYYVAFMLVLILVVALRAFKVEPYMRWPEFDVPGVKQVLYGLFFVQGQLNSSFWTLCVEARWYLLLPLLLLVNRRFGLPALFLLSCIVSLCYFPVLATGTSHLAGKISLICSVLPFYLPTFVAGIAVAHFAAAKEHSHLRSFVVRNARFGLLISIVLVVFFTSTHERDNFERLIPGTLLAFFALLSAIFDKNISRLLSRKGIVAIGTASYSIYLLHVPLILLACAQIQRLGWSQPAQFCFYELFYGPLLVAIGIGFFTLVERPLLRKRQKQALSNRVSIPAAREIAT